MSTTRITAPTDRSGGSDITDHLREAFDVAATAREQVDTAEDNIRALVADAVAAGVTWETLESVSGLSALALQHRYQIVDPNQVDTVPADPLLLLP